VNRLTLKQQRLITIAIKQARILSSLPFLNNERQFGLANSNQDFNKNSMNGETFNMLL
jgi:hypothetical protein